jgi:hypothetical protein
MVEEQTTINTRRCVGYVAGDGTAERVMREILARSGA